MSKDHLDSKQTSSPDAATGETETKVSTKKQFGIAALFWITFIIGLGVAYLDNLESTNGFGRSMVIGALIAVAIGAVVGLVIGKLTGNLRDALFWATLVAAFGYITTAPYPAYVLGHRLAWAGVGAVSGAIGSTMFLDKWWIRGLACALAGGIPMIIYYFVGGNRLSHDLMFDLNAAPLIGGCVAAFVSGLLWLESKQEMPRYITATWLMVAVVLGNLFS